MKCKVVGGSHTWYHINGSMVNGGTEIEIDDKLFKKHKDVLEQIEEKEEIEVEGGDYTEQELRDIVDAGGIAGLREVGDQFGVKFRSIEEGIKEILGAQR